MDKYIYVVRLETGRSHQEYSIFLENVNKLNAKSPHYNGIESVCVLSHHVDAKTIFLLCTETMDEKNDVTVEEVTKTTLTNDHSDYADLVESYFLPYGTYPKIS